MMASKLWDMMKLLPSLANDVYCRSLPCPRWLPFCLVSEAQPSFLLPNEAGYKVLLLCVTFFKNPWISASSVAMWKRSLPALLSSLAVYLWSFRRQWHFLHCRYDKALPPAYTRHPRDCDCQSICCCLVWLWFGLEPLAAAPSVMRLDPTPGFASLSNDATLRQYGFVVYVEVPAHPRLCGAVFWFTLLLMLPTHVLVISISIDHVV